MADPAQFVVPSAPVSRRRLALRPSTSAASSSSTTVTAAPEPEPPPMPTLESKPTKAVWNGTEVNAFYEALKKHGKDFEAVVKTLVKRNISRDKDQVRNFYFNALKTFKAACLFDDELFPEISKDVKEMFIVINAYEWKRKTNNAPFDATSFKKLVLEGVVTLKMKGRRQPLVIRTPSCPCLLKYFTDRVGGLPSSVVLQLLPRTYGDRDFVVRCEQNPFLRINVSMNDRIGRVFQLLKTKWRYPIEREGEIMPDDREYRLFVDSHVALSRLRIAKKNPRTDSFISMKRLMKGQQSERGTTVEVPPLPRRDEPGPSNRTVSMSSCSETEEDDFSDILIAADQIADGMTEENCGSHAVVELYYLCGRPEVIKLNYTISDPSMKNAIQPWQIFLDFLKRDYGKKLAVGMMDKEKTRHRTKEKSESEKGPVVQDENSNSNGGEVQDEAQTPRVNRKRVAMHNTPPMLPASVAADAAAAAAKQFDAGLNRLQPRSKVRKVVKSALERDTNLSFQSSLKQPPNCPIIEAEANNFMKQYKEMKSRGKRMPIPSTSSSISTTNNVIQAAANRNPFAVSELSDSSKQRPPEPEPQPGPSRELLRDGPIATSTLMDMSELSGNSIHHWFPNFGNETNDFSLMSNSSATFGQQLNLSANGKTLPEDVRHSYEMMMQQNSVDYCRNFEQLLQSTQETPTKNH
ncbi:hypothetical protein QR680_014827 [Steinernema hermaphroditum]|uniref:Myb-like domain-containing protein n=1 Tax=Steinernema hermaphroditum TaxID=289476 RepID=A0AA39ICH5_9BILA|nr:hypothetical protein QR680_014827 [Steinernema hermaphroditum]